MLAPEGAKEVAGGVGIGGEGAADGRVLGFREVCEDGGVGGGIGGGGEFFGMGFHGAGWIIDGGCRGIGYRGEDFFEFRGGRRGMLS